MDNLPTIARGALQPINRGRRWTIAAGAVLLCSLGSTLASAHDLQPKKVKEITAKVEGAKKTLPKVRSAQPHNRHFSGIASFYDKDYAGTTASGARYDGRKYTAAHRTLPFGTRVRVTDKKSHRSVTVIVNDRGPFIKGRVIDLSYAAARALHMEERGLVQVTASIE